MELIHQSYILLVSRFVNKQLRQKNILFGEFLALLKALTADESQTIQVIAIESLVPFGNLLKKHNNTSALTTDVLPLVKAFADDPSWKLRLALAKGYSQFCAIFAAAEISADVFPALIHLIQDPEPEVRSLAILEVFPFLEIVGTTLFITELAPVALQLVDDPVDAAEFVSRVLPNVKFAMEVRRGGGSGRRVCVCGAQNAVLAATGAGS